MNPRSPASRRRVQRRFGLALLGLSLWAPAALIDRDRARILASPAPTTRLRLFEELTARAIISNLPGLARRLDVSPRS